MFRFHFDLEMYFRTFLVQENKSLWFSVVLLLGIEALKSLHMSSLSESCQPVDKKPVVIGQKGSNGNQSKGELLHASSIIIFAAKPRIFKK